MAGREDAENAKKNKKKSIQYYSLSGFNESSDAGPILQIEPKRFDSGYKPEPTNEKENYLKSLSPLRSRRPRLTNQYGQVCGEFVFSLPKLFKIF